MLIKKKEINIQITGSDNRVELLPQLTRPQFCYPPQPVEDNLFLGLTILAMVLS